jgi:hypothetical protein
VCGVVDYGGFEGVKGEEIGYGLGGGVLWGG